MSNSFINIGKKPVYRGVYNVSTKYYSENMVAMCACLFQCAVPSIVGVPPITIDASGNASFANTSSWNVIIDNLALYNNISYVEEKTVILREIVDEFIITISDDWKKNTNYVVGNYVIKGGALYKCVADHNSGNTFDSTKWQQTTIANMVDDSLSANIATKEYVNDKVATSTANFVGTYNSLAELQAVQNPTNNDYGFVIETDAQGNEYYDRYKYVASSQQWLFEYKVESTPFTAAQWAAIQSGITSALVTKLNALPTAQQLSNQMNGKQDTISDLATIRSGSAKGETAVQHNEINKFIKEGEVFGAGSDSAASFNPYADTVWNKQQTLSESQKQQIRDNIGVGAADNEDIQNVNGTLKFADRAYTATTSSVQGNMGYKILRKNSTFASQLTAANTIYEIRYDYDLDGQTVTIPANCVLKFNGGKLGNGTLVGQNTTIDADIVPIFDGLSFSGTWVTSQIYPQWFGAIGDGVTNDTTSFIALARFVNILNGGCIYIPSGHYIINNRISINCNIKIIGEGSSSWLDFSGHVENVAYADLAISGASVELDTTISSDVANGDTSIILNNVDNISAGDILAILDNAPGSLYDEEYRGTEGNRPAYFREYYKQGDYIEVDSVSENTIISKSAIHGNYKASGNIKIFKLSPVSCIISGLHITSADTITYGGALPLAFYYCKDISVSNIILEGTNFAHINLSNVIGANIEGISIDYKSQPIGLNYGIAVGSSMDIVISNCRIRVTRHSITCGAASSNITIPSRNIQVNGGVYRGNGASDQASIDAHENTEYITINNVLCEGGCWLSGNHIRVSNCVFKSDSQYTNAMLSIRPIGGDVSISNNLFEYEKALFSSSNSRQAATVNGSYITKDAGHLIINGNNIIISKETILASPEFVCIYVHKMGVSGGFNDVVITANHIIVGDGKAVAIGYGEEKNVSAPGIKVENTTSKIVISSNILRGCDIRVFPEYDMNTELNIIDNEISQGYSEGIVLARGTTQHLKICNIARNVISNFTISENMGIRINGFKRSPEVVNIVDNVFMDDCIAILVNNGGAAVENLIVSGNKNIRSASAQLAQNWWLSLNNITNLGLSDNYNLAGGIFRRTDVNNIYDPSIIANNGVPSVINIPGRMYYDLSYKRPEWYDGEKWVEYDGENRGIARVSSTPNRPTPNKAGFVFWDSNLVRPIWYYNGNWWDSDRMLAAIKVGTTEQRTALSGLSRGYMFFDTTLGRWVYYDGVWKYMDGTAV